MCCVRFPALSYVYLTTLPSEYVTLVKRPSES